MKTMSVTGHRILIKVDEDTIEKSIQDEIQDAIKKVGGDHIKGKEIFRGNICLGAISFDPEERKKAAQRGAESGIVVQIGPTAYLEFAGDPWCKVGDKIFFQRYQGQQIPDGVFKDQSRYIVLNDDDVLFVEHREEA